MPFGNMTARSRSGSRGLAACRLGRQADARPRQGLGRAGWAAALGPGASDTACGPLPGFFRGGWAEQAITRLLGAVAAIPVLIRAVALAGVFDIREMQVSPFTLGNEAKPMPGLVHVPALARITCIAAAGEIPGALRGGRRGWRAGASCSPARSRITSPRPSSRRR
ncbi:hypothetical protein [Siccirubricoccus phaeus]|uniref:hypothetical protein n=1 Tax=Siccirubricoccus phaeus TaxID=2595053 RepID=UPI0011F2E0D7|nr:hypothetical protein [Siccirubricoccus phaeus]